MAKTIPLDNIALRRVPKELRAAVKTAGEMGWTGRPLGDGGVMLYSPDRETMVSIPMKIGDSHTVRNIARQILRGTPEAAQRDFADRVADRVALGEDGADEGVRALGAVLIEAAGPLGINPEVFAEQTGIEAPPAPPEPEAATEGPTIAREKPWVVTRGGTRPPYPSKFVVERIWTDGRIEYACAACGHVGPTPLAVTRHAQRHGREDHWPGQREPRPAPVKQPLIDFDEPEPEPVVEPAPEPEPQPLEVFSDEQVIAQMRQILLGREMAQIASLEAQVDVLTRALSDTERRLVEAEAEANRAQEMLSTVAGLVQDAVKEAKK